MKQNTVLLKLMIYCDLVGSMCFVLFVDQASAVCFRLVCTTWTGRATTYYYFTTCVWGTLLLHTCRVVELYIAGHVCMLVLCCNVITHQTTTVHQNATILYRVVMHAWRVIL